MIRTQRWIECSYCDAEFAGKPNTFGGEVGADIRKRARAAGWRLVTVAGRSEDVCPAHPDIGLSARRGTVTP